MSDEIQNAAKLILNDAQARRDLTEGILDNGARSAMRRAIGDRTHRQYDKADEIAAGIEQGVYGSLRQLAGVDK